MFAVVAAALMVVAPVAHVQHHAPVTGLAHRPHVAVYNWPVTYSQCRQSPLTGQLICPTTTTTSLRARAL